MVNRTEVPYHLQVWEAPSPPWVVSLDTERDFLSRWGGKLISVHKDTMMSLNVKCNGKEETERAFTSAPVKIWRKRLITYKYPSLCNWCHRFTAQNVIYVDWCVTLSTREPCAQLLFHACMPTHMYVYIILWWYLQNKKYFCWQIVIQSCITHKCIY